jgi:Domain of unknown function (DUF1883)
MKYAYLDLGRRQAGNAVVVRVRGGATGVLLLSAADFLRYRADRSFRFHGGRYRGRPVRIDVPRDDHWFVVLEVGSYNGRARATVEVLTGADAGSAAEPARVLVDA